MFALDIELNLIINYRQRVSQLGPAPFALPLRPASAPPSPPATKVELEKKKIASERGRLPISRGVSQLWLGSELRSLERLRKSAR